MKLATVESILDEADAYEAWRPALIAFWRTDGCFARANSLERGDALDYLDRRTADGIKAAMEKL